MWQMLALNYDRIHKEKKIKTISNKNKIINVQITI